MSRKDDDMNFHQEFELAKKSIVSAGKIAQDGFDKGLVQKSKDLAHDYLTETDIEVEQFLKTELLKQFPDYGFIGEEGDATEKPISWIVDPIDGTASFANHMTEFGVAVALKHDQEIIFGLEYLPVQHELYSAYIGEGAFCNDKKIMVDVLEKFNPKSFISLGHQNFWDDNYIDYSLKLVASQHNLRVGQSSVFESTLVASGKIPFMARFGQALWDTVAQYRIMTEAGALVTDRFGKPLRWNFSKDSLYDFVATTTGVANNQASLIYFKADPS